MKTIKRKQKGFTLIELLIVVAILGILAAVAIPALTSFIVTSRVGAANGELGLVRTGVHAMLADAQVATTDAVSNVSASNSTTAGAGSYNLNSYIQGTTTSLRGWYVVATNGNITNASYPGGPVWQGGNATFVKP